MRPKEIEMIKISIIIPIYNAANYLEACLESVRCQSFQGYEVWLVDDGSTDRSGGICDRFAAEDARFHVIHKANGGASAARNVGIEQAQGEWICFVDSDDTVEPDYLSALYSYAQRPEILVVQGFRTLFARRLPEERSFETRFYPASEVYRTFRDLHIHRCGFPFGKLYNASLLRKHRIRFMESVHYAEDVLFMLTYLCHCQGIQTVGGMNYNYYIRGNADSLSRKIFSFESEYLCYQTYLERMGQLQQHFSLPPEVLAQTYLVISEYLVRRALGSLYQPQTAKPRRERLRILRSITPEQIDFLTRYYTHCSWFHRATVFFLRKRAYGLCDGFNKSIACRFFLKKLIDKYL